MNENTKLSALQRASAAKTGRLLRRMVKDYLRPYLRQLGMAIAFMVVSAGLTAGFAKLIQPVLDDVLVARRTELIVPMAVTVLVLFMANGVATFMHTVTINKIGQSIVGDIQTDLFSRFMGMDLRFFHDNASGQLMARMVNDTNVMRAAVAESLTGFGKNFLTLLFLVILMFMQDGRLALIAICVFPPAAGCVALLGRKLRKMSRRTQGEVADLSSFLSQIFQGIRQVKAYGMEDRERKRADEAIRRVRGLYIKAFRTGNLSTPVNETLIGLALMGVIVYGGYQVAGGQLTVGQLMSFIAAFALAYEPLKRLAKLNNNFQMGLGAAERVFEMLDMRPAITDREGAVDLDTRNPAISFRNVSFGYGFDNKKALDGVSFDVPAGKVTALVGASGSGKTTAMNLVPRFYDVTGGILTVDGRDARELTLKSLRAHIALVSQDVTIFDDTARANIAYGRAGATDADIEAAAKAAAADEFIRAMPEGYDTRLGELGVRLSGGQRQRIAIARAMLRNAPILLLDEATSALDTESERAIQESLERLQEGRTTLVIAHRLSTVRRADNIIVLESGRVAEQGRHDDLLAKGGVYARMYSRGLEE